MRFYTPNWNVKRRAKRLKSALEKHGHQLTYTRCLDLMARLYGFAHFAEMKHSEWPGPPSQFDEHVDDETLEARFQKQERVMAEAGFANVAGAVLDTINPTGRGNRQIAISKDESDQIADEGV